MSTEAGPYQTKPMSSLVDLAKAYAEMDAARRRRFMAEVEQILDRIANMPALPRSLTLLGFSQFVWVDDDKGELTVTVEAQRGATVFEHTTKI